MSCEREVDVSAGHEEEDVDQLFLLARSRSLRSVASYRCCLGIHVSLYLIEVSISESGFCVIE